MTIDFDLDDADAVVEFGLGIEEGGDIVFYTVPVGAEVKNELLAMVRRTCGEMDAFEEGERPYSPAEKHGATEYLVVSAGGDFDAPFRKLHDAEDLEEDTEALLESDGMLSYFVRLIDDVGRRLTAIRRATYFKGILRSRGRLVRLFDDTLMVVEDDVFKLDTDFDLLVDSTATHIWRPTAFEFLGGLKQAVLDAVPTNVEAIQQDLPFVNLASIEEYATSHVRAARYLASIRTQELSGLDRDALLNLCRKTGVPVENQGGVLVPGDNKIGFLEVLDRRRYELELVRGQPERFRAGSRDRIGRP